MSHSKYVEAPALKLLVFAPFARETPSQEEGVRADPLASSIQPWEDPRWLQHLCPQPPLPAPGLCSSWKLKLSSPKPWPTGCPCSHSSICSKK